MVGNPDAECAQPRVSRTQRHRPTPFGVRVGFRGRDRTRLEDRQRARPACPLHVRRPAEQILDLLQCVEDSTQIVAIEQGLRLARCRSWIALPASPTQNLFRLAIDLPAIRVGGSVDQKTARTRDGLDDRSITRTPAWILPEGHARSIGVNHLLNQHGHPAAGGVQPQLPPIQQRGIGPKRGPDHAHGLADLRLAAHIGDGLVKAGEG